MDSVAYNNKYKFWVATKEQLENVLLKQKILEEAEPITDRFTAHCIFADMYCDYVDLVNKLGYIYHRTFQVQKRILLNNLLEAAGNRLCELRNELKDIELSEFIYIDRTVLQRKIAYNMVHISRPEFFPYLRDQEINNIINIPSPQVLEHKKKIEEENFWKNRLENMRKNLTDTKNTKRYSGLLEAYTNEYQATKKPKEILTECPSRVIEAITLIQTHEKLRIQKVRRQNIRTNPTKFMPKTEQIQIPKSKYEFSFKPDQEMLIPVRKTTFNRNFYRSKTKQEFDFYIKPRSKNIIENIPSNIVENVPHCSISGAVLNDDLLIDMSGQTLTPRIEKSSILQSVESFRKHHKKSIEGEKNYSVDIHAAGDGRIEMKKKRRFKLTLARRKQNSYETNLIMEEEIADMAARIIQEAWQKYLYRKEFEELKEKRAILIHAASEFKPIENPLENLIARSYELKTIKDQYLVDFIKACENEKARIVIRHSDFIMEDISDHIRFWLQNFYEQTQNLPPFPIEAKGGTIMVLLENVITPQEFNANKNKSKSEIKEAQKKLKNKEKKAALKLKLAEKSIEKKYEAKKKEMEKVGEVYYDFGKQLVRNKNTNVLKEQMTDIKGKWYYEVEEKFNSKEAPFLTWISEEKFAEVHIALRKIVDQMMRLEYELLRKALAFDKKKKYKPSKEPKAKKRRRSKKNQKAPEIDKTAYLSTAEIYEEMKNTGLIRKYPKRCFEEFFGDLNYCAYDLKNYFQLEVLPSTLEMRDILREWILGMGPLQLPKYKSILIVGPPKSAKIQLCEILASEIDAVVIDLSMEIVAHYKYDIDYLVHLVQKMSIILQPTIILIENVHRTFWKKIPEDCKEFQPRILTKKLKKIIKKIKHNDKIFVLATSDEPWAGKSKMKKLFEKIILMPQTNYPSSFMLWRSLILQKFGVPRNIELSPLAYVCRNYTCGEIAENVEATINIERRMLFMQKKLKLDEFVEKFISMTTFPKIDGGYKKFYKWYKKTNKLEKKRIKVKEKLKKAGKQ